MTKLEEIKLLRQYRECVRMLREYEAEPNTRERLAQLKPFVAKIMKREGTHKIFTISPPPMLGGPIMNIDPLENLFDVPYGLTYDVRGNVLDMVDETIGLLQSGEHQGEPEFEKGIWQIMHPEIIRVSKQRYDAGLFADAVESAFKEINIRVRGLYIAKGGVTTKDGAELMYSAFGERNPVLRFKSSSQYSDSDIQKGYSHLYAGAMQGIRNPKAHANEMIGKEDALRKLAFASMLMYKLEDVE